MARPDDDSAFGAQLRHRSNGRLDISVGEVSEHTTNEDEIGRDSTDKGIGARGIADDHLDAGKTSPSCTLASYRCEIRINFNQSGFDTLGARMARKHTEKVEALPGAQAEHSLLANGSRAKELPDEPLNNGQSVGEHSR